jgi:hypothetical protein
MEIKKTMFKPDFPPRIKKKFLASFNNYEEACTMLCGKGRVRTQDLGYQAERYDHCATRPVPPEIYNI